MMEQVRIQRRISDLLRSHFPDCVIVSWDDLEGTDKLRDCFMVNITLLESGATNWRTAVERYEIAITYYAPLKHSSVHLVKVTDKLNRIFEREFSVDRTIFFIFDKSILTKQHEVDFSFEVEFRRALARPFTDKDVTTPNEKYENHDALENITDIHYKEV